MCIRDRVTTEEAATNELLLTGRRPDCDETYTVTCSRLGFTSPASNAILVKGSGVEGVYLDQSLIGWTDDGFMVLAESLRNLRVYSPDGRTVYTSDEALRGQSVTLPTGIYIIAADGFRPARLVRR